jgi:predicted DNA-binding ribbon-helix-helix protein
VKPAPPRKSRLVNQNVMTAARRTSMRLEPEFWQALNQIAEREGVSRNELIRSVEGAAPTVIRTSAVRVFILEYFIGRDRVLADRPAQLAGHLPEQKSPRGSWASWRPLRT